VSRRIAAPWTRRGFARALAAAPLASLGAGGRGDDAETVVDEARSPYNHIVVTEHGSVRTMYFVVDGTHYIESRVDRAHPRSLDLDYTRTMMAGFLVQPRPRRLLMIGFGGGQISNYLFGRFPELEIDAVDIDAEVIRLARKWFDVPDDPRYRTHAADGRVWVERQSASARWDMIVLDAFRGVFVPYHLKTAEYYGVLRDHLADEGVVAANLHHTTPMYASDRATFAAAFPTGYAFHAERSMQTTYVASASARRVGTYPMRENARSLRGRFDFDLLGLAARWYLGVDFDPRAEVLHDDFAPDDSEAAAERHNRHCRGEKCRYRSE
jgi:spermidine synthase